MKILILIDHYPPYVKGGAELNCALITQALIKRGYDISILTTTYGVSHPQDEGNIYRRLYYSEIANKSKIDRRMNHFRLFLSSIRNINIIKEMIKKVQPEFIITWNFEYDALLSPIFTIQDMGIPNIFAIRSHWPIHLTRQYSKESNVLKRFYRSLLIGCHRFSDLNFQNAIFVSNAVYEDCLSEGIQVKHSAVIHNGIPDEWIKTILRPWSKDNSPIKLLYVGRFEAAKGTDVAIKAIDYLVNEKRLNNIQLDLYGQGEERYIRDLKEYVNTHSLSDHIHFNSPISREDLLKKYSDYHVLLFTTPEYEAAPNAILEAMSQGVLVISSSISATREIIDDGIDGFLVPPKDPFVLGQCIERVIKSNNNIMEIRVNALEKLKKQYSFSRAIDAYEIYLQSCKDQKDKDR